MESSRKRAKVAGDLIRNLKRVIENGVYGKEEMIMLMVFCIMQGQAWQTLFFNLTA
jgi:hypothetical protein